MKTNRIIMAACLSLIGFAHAQDKAIDCKDQGKFNLCNINEKVGLKSISPVGNVQVEVKTTSPVGPGQVAGAQVQQPVSENKSNTAKIIEAVKAAPVPQPDVVKDEYTYGKHEWKIFSCVEMAPIRYWAKNPDNRPNMEVRNDYGSLRGKTDANGWFETLMTYNDNGKPVTGFGGGVASRQAVYKNGVFDYWSGWPKATPIEMDKAGWGWNFASIGSCESKINGPINNSPNFSSDPAPTPTPAPTKPTPTPAPTKPTDEYTYGKHEWKIFSCVEMAPIRYWAKNPDNRPNMEVRNDYGSLRGKTDANGWFETLMTYNDNGKPVTGFGGGVASRQAVYKNGVFDYWSGWPKASPIEMDKAGWGWNFASIGSCESKINGPINNSPDFK